MLTRKKAMNPTYPRRGATPQTIPVARPSSCRSQKRMERRSSFEIEGHPGVSAFFSSSNLQLPHRDAAPDGDDEEDDEDIRTMQSATCATNSRLDLSGVGKLRLLRLSILPSRW